MACARHRHVPTSKTGMPFTQEARPDLCSQDLKYLGRFAFSMPLLVQCAR